MTEILDEDAVSEIEDRANAASPGPWESDNAEDYEHRYQYYMAIDPASRVLFDTFNSALGEIHEEADEDGVYRWDEVARRNIAFASHAREDIPALCATVKHLRAERVGHILITETDNATYDRLVNLLLEEDHEPGGSTLDADDILKQIIQQRDAAQSQLEQLRAENERLRSGADALIALDRQEIEASINDFRTRAIQLCKDKAAKYKALADNSLPNDQTASRTAAIAAALTAFATELEKL